MLDFIEVKVESVRKDVIQIYPEFIAKKSKDLMIKGHSFYAIWDEEANLWSTSEFDAERLIDQMVIKFANEYQTPDKKIIKLLKNFSSRKFQEWQTYCKSMPDNFHWLDERIIFKNNEINKKDYSSMQVPYALEPGPTDAWDELIGTLYEPNEKEKLEWAIGALVTGDSTRLQKFLVLYGPPGSGKSTFLDILQEMFPGYYHSFDSGSLTNGSAFGLESLRDNPLIAIDDDCNLSNIEDNTKLNSVVSHAPMIVNEKFKSTYSARFRSFLFLGTNEPVKIRNAKSGIIRRLIDVNPSGLKINKRHYNELRKQIHFEYGAIASKCAKLYKHLGENYYEDYIPIKMIDATNTFYNFIEDELLFFTSDHPDGISLDTAWRRYKLYCDDANVHYPYSKMIFKHELKNYFESFEETGGPAKAWYKDFKQNNFKLKVINKDKKSWIHLETQESLFDDAFQGCLAQYTNEAGIPRNKWSKVKTKLMDLDTTKEHYVQLPEDIIVLDFDKKNEKGEKDLDLNMAAASQFPRTYTETSKSGRGLHLVYIYDGDPNELAAEVESDIEIKIYKNPIRRKLLLCNDLPITHINSGLPLKEKKGDKKVISDAAVRTEQGLRKQIEANLRKEYHSDTSSSINFIKKILDEAYDSGMQYDVRDMANDILLFASNSTNQAEKCVKTFHEMKLCSEILPTSKDDSGLSNIVTRDVFISKMDHSEYVDSAPLCFFDVEVFPNLFIICWKKLGSKTVNRMINPAPDEVSALFANPNFRWIGFNNRKYDNHIVFARMMGYNELQLFNLSQNIIKEGVLKWGFLKAYNISYTDIYDFASNVNKMSLKKWEIKMGIDHVELDIPWDKEVAKELWDKVADYCCNDVNATEALWLYTDPKGKKPIQTDFRAREILADLAGLTVNDTTNACTTKIIVGDDPVPQEKFIYTDLSTIFPGYEYDAKGIDKSRYNPGTKIVKGKSIYRGEDPGEGGYVYATPGIWYNVPVMDVESMHPTSAHELMIFGKDYTDKYWEIVQARLTIKHKDYDLARTMMGGKLAKYLGSEEDAKDLANALKTAINSVYGLTSATFSNKLRDPRNKDNIVAKRGALFMINLKHEIEDRGFTVVHIKTDSIKIADATDDIIEFVKEYGLKYGYKFAKEAVYSKMALVNESTYIAEVVEEDEKPCKPYWTPTGEQFAVPYVFKKLFSHEEVTFDDLCETKSVSTAMYLDFADGSSPRFVGRVGRFTPVKPGCGGGILLRDSGNGDGKFAAVNGTKKPYKDLENPTYYWKEAEIVKTLHEEDKIDISYWDYLVTQARETIGKFGDPEAFIEGGPVGQFDVSPSNIVEELPFGKPTGWVDGAMNEPEVNAA